MYDDLTNPESNSTSDAKLWSAYLYLTGELHAAESVQFEQQLENSPELCDLLAQLSMLDELLLKQHMTTTISPVGSVAPQLAKLHQSPQKTKSQAFVRYFSKWHIAGLGLTVVAVIGMCVLNLAGTKAFLFPASQVVQQNTLLQPLTNDEMSDMLGVWLNKPMSITQESTVLATLDSTDDENESIPSNSESAPPSEVPDWLLIALQVEANESMDSNEI